MGDLLVWPHQPKSIATAAATSNPQSSQPANPHPSAIGATVWLEAEQATMEVIRFISPTMVSEQRRKAVVEYVQKLIRVFLSSEVFPFGSVPLKTYLPDGDIDLTAIGIPSSEEALASDVRLVLEREEHNKDAEFKVKDVQYIHAEVKLVKCLVQNIVVDISFNQIGGLGTLCFLEQVDCIIGKDHLFKRSVILIKAWCYYESRILGAHHGLISTYALEVLILYIFHHFHSSLDGPLAVLYRFLEYYSKFDWDNYCISLHGPVPLSSLPELSAEKVDDESSDRLLTEEFLRSCVVTFSVPSRGLESNYRTFTKKHLNIIDPLRESNNLGRSVSKGNFYRIRSAFTYGARKLGCLLLLPAGSILDELNMFFMDTMDRHGFRKRFLVSRLIDKGTAESNGVNLVSHVQKSEKKEANKMTSESTSGNVHSNLNNEMEKIEISGLVEYKGKGTTQRPLLNEQQNRTKVLSVGAEVNVVSTGRLIGDAQDLAAERTFLSGTLNKTQKASTTMEGSVLGFRKPYHAPHLFFLSKNRTRKEIKADPIYSTSLDAFSNVPSSGTSIPNEKTIISMHPDSAETDSSTSGACRIGNCGNPSPCKGSPLIDFAPEGNESIGSSGLPNEFSDLSGDEEMHMNSLMYAKWCQGQVMDNFFLPVQRSPTYPYLRGNDAWSHGSTFAAMNPNAPSPRPPFSPTFSCPANPPFISSTFGTEDVAKPRGTGTYFPNTDYHVYRERHSPGRVKNSVSGNHSPRPRNDGCMELSLEVSSMERGHQQQVNQATTSFSCNKIGRAPAVLDKPQTSAYPATTKAPPSGNGKLFPPDYSKLEFGSLGPFSFGDATTENCRKDTAISHDQCTGFSKPASTYQKLVINSDRGRLSESYKLKDEDDFPPLSG